MIALLRRVSEFAAAMMFGGMFFMFLLQVFFRYLLNNPLPWTQELITILWVWSVFWTSAFLLTERDHIAFDLIAVSLPRKGQRVLALLASLLMFVAFAAALPACWAWTSFMRVETTPIIGLRYDYFASIFLVFMAAVALASAWRVARLMSSRWREELSPSKSESQGDETP